MKPRPALAALSGLCATILISGSFNASALPKADVAQAQQTTDLLTGALVAAVASISDATPPGATLDDIEAASTAVSALVPECQLTYRLIDATGDPLDPGNVAGDRFELRGLEHLVDGDPLIQHVVGSELRTLVPLTSDMHTNCMTCHGNYAALPPGSVVGAASLRVGL